MFFSKVGMYHLHLCLPCSWLNSLCAHVLPYWSPQTLWVTPVISAPLPLTTGKTRRQRKGLYSHASCYRCMLLEDSRQLYFIPAYSKHWRVNLSRKQKNGPLCCWTKPYIFSFSPLFESSNPAFISKHCPSFSSAAFNRPLSYFLSPSSPLLLHSQTENVRWANAIHSRTKGKLGLLLQDLIDWCLRRDSPSPLTLSLAEALCVFLFYFFSLSFTHTHTNMKLNSAWGNVCLQSG